MLALVPLPKVRANSPTSARTFPCALRKQPAVDNLKHNNNNKKTMKKQNVNPKLSFSKRDAIRRMLALKISASVSNVVRNFSLLGTGHKWPREEGGGESGRVITFSAPQKGGSLKILNYQKGGSHKFKLTLYDSFTLLKVPKQITVIIV